MLTIAGGILLAFVALGVFVAVVVAFERRGELKQVRYRNEQERARRSLQEANKPPQEESMPAGLRGLGDYLDRREADEEAEKRREEDRLTRLKVAWAEISPTVTQAVELVNSKLAPHKMHVSLSPQDFFGQERTAYGALCKLHIDGEPTFGLAYSGEQCLAVTGDEDDGRRLYAGGCHSWRDGVPFQLNELATDKLADVIADTVKSLLEG